jgi:hypothetical protein
MAQRSGADLSPSTLVEMKGNDPSATHHAIALLCAIHAREQRTPRKTKRAAATPNGRPHPNHVQQGLLEAPEERNQPLPDTIALFWRL